MHLTLAQLLVINSRNKANADKVYMKSSVNFFLGVWTYRKKYCIRSVGIGIEIVCNTLSTFIDIWKISCPFLYAECCFLPSIRSICSICRFSLFQKRYKNPLRNEVGHSLINQWSVKYTNADVFSLEHYGINGLCPEWVLLHDHFSAQSPFPLGAIQ